MRRVISVLIHPACSPFRHVLPLRKYYDGIRVIERFITPYIESTLRLPMEELEQLSKSDKEFTFLHNIALFSRDPQVIRDQIFAVLIAGRDTTAATLSWAFYELANYPDVWRKLRNQVLARRPNSNPIVRGPQKPDLPDAHHQRDSAGCTPRSLITFAAAVRPVLDPYTVVNGH